MRKENTERGLRSEGVASSEWCITLLTPDLRLNAQNFSVTLWSRSRSRSGSESKWSKISYTSTL